MLPAGIRRGAKGPLGSFLKTSLDNQSQKTNSNNKSEKLLPGEISLYVFVKGVFLPLPATKGHTRYFESTKPLRLLASVMLKL